MTDQKPVITGYLHPTKGFRKRKFVASERAKAMVMSDGRLVLYKTMEQRMREKALREAEAKFHAARTDRPAGDAA